MLLLLLLTITCASARTFNITHISVPDIVPARQQEVEIECRYDANFTILTWFKGSKEFFRYRPGAAPSTRSFPVIGVGTVEMVSCGPTACMLRLGALTEQASGQYMCNIERDVPPYKFETRSASMTVLGHEQRRPLLEGLAGEFAHGDLIQAYCRGAPDSEVRWYINGEELLDMRGSLTLERNSTRLIFKGLPPTITVQCAEFRHGKIYGSKEAKAVWYEIGHLRDNKTKRENNSSNVSAYLSSLCVVLFIMTQVYRNVCKYIYLNM